MDPFLWFCVCVCVFFFLLIIRTRYGILSAVMNLWRTLKVTPHTECLVCSTTPPADSSAHAGEFWTCLWYLMASEYEYQCSCMSIHIGVILQKGIPLCDTDTKFGFCSFVIKKTCVCVVCVRVCVCVRPVYFYAFGVKCTL